jgi:hypothetical protein
MNKRDYAARGRENKGDIQMKTWLGSIFTVLFMASAAGAMQVLYSGPMVSTNGVVLEIGKSSTQTYTMDVNASGGDVIGAQISYGSATISAMSFGDGATATGNITVVSTSALVGSKSSSTITVSSNSALSAYPAYASINVTSNTFLPAALGHDTLIFISSNNAGVYGSTVVINVSSYTFGTSGSLNQALWDSASSTQTAVNFASMLNMAGLYRATVVLGTGVYVTTESTQSYAVSSSTTTQMYWSASTFSGYKAPSYFSVNYTTLTANTDFTVGDSTVATAASIAQAINSHVAGVHATVSPVLSSSITIVAIASGTTGNSYLLTSSTAAALPVVSFKGGLDFASFTMNSRIFTNHDDWWSGNTASNTAVAIKNAINGASMGVIASTQSSTSVLITANSTGTYANAFTLNSSTVALSTTGFTGGVNDAVFGIAGTYYTQGSDWLVGASTAATATNIAALLNVGSQATFGVNVSTAHPCNTFPGYCGIVYATMPVTGSSYNFALYSSTQSALTVSGLISSSTVTGEGNGTMAGGVTADYSLSTPTIISTTSHMFTTGNPVLFSTGSAISLSPLVWGTTYFVIKLDANDIALATSSTGAVAGLRVVLTSSRTVVSSATFTLTPVAISGVASFTLQASDDGLYWVNISTANYGYAIGAISFATPWTASSALWDLGQFNHRYLRLSFMGPPTGAVRFTFTLNQKNNKWF